MKTYEKYLITEGMNDNKLNKMLFVGVPKTLADKNLFLSFAHYVTRTNKGDNIHKTKNSKTVGEEIWNRVFGDRSEFFDQGSIKKLEKNWAQISKMINKEWDFDKAIGKSGAWVKK